ncbi:MAG: lysophospholipid acyltransferase family protein [Planctomycetota bacterium]|nr:lysophospholipid acyltransferase family protein [Planctomycetota bacterium]
MIADPTLIAAIVLAWLAIAALSSWVAAGATRGDIHTGIIKRAIEVYAFVFHGLRVQGREHIPRAKDAGPLVVVANHTAGIDPLLIQAVCPFEIRWVMAQDMRRSFAEPIWRFARVIFVDRRADSRDASALREAIRHVKSGGVVGVFPEGGIERPPRTLRPFESGVGMLIGRTGAPALLFIIEGTPTTRTAWGSLLAPSRTRLRVLPLMQPDEMGRRGGDVAANLHNRFQDATGWPASGPAIQPE